MTEQVQVLGLRELREALVRTVPGHFQGKVLQKALTAGARPVVSTARQLVPVKTGVLRRAIYWFRDKANSNGVFEQKAIGVRSGKRYRKSGKDAFYWRWIEFGRSAFSARKKGGTLGTPEKGFFGSSVGPVLARPFLRPAFERNKRDAVEKIRDSLATEIPKAARKASWRTPSR